MKKIEKKLMYFGSGLFLGALLGRYAPQILSANHSLVLVMKLRDMQEKEIEAVVYKMQQTIDTTMQNYRGEQSLASGAPNLVSALELRNFFKGILKNFNTWGVDETWTFLMYALNFSSVLKGEALQNSKADGQSYLHHLLQDYDLLLAAVHQVVALQQDARKAKILKRDLQDELQALRSVLPRTCLREPLS